jgi:hypothetical protein
MAGDNPEKPKVPADLSAPGLIYRLRRRGWVLSWSPRSDLMERGYQGKAVKLWPSDRVSPRQSEPTRTEWEVISAWCVRYHAEQLLWARGGVDDDPKSQFDGTVGSLIEIFQKHRKSPFNKVRYYSQLTYAHQLRALKAAIGKVRVRYISFDDISNWQEEFADDDDGGKQVKSRSANLIVMLKRIVIFGALVLSREAGCHDVCDIFAKMAEAHLMESRRGRRKEYMTAAQCRLLRAKAQELGFPSIALQQAFAFELGLRQKDTIGEWIPVKWPGLSDVICGGKKWVIGLRWEEIGVDLVLRHRLSKSVHGAQTIMDSEAGTWKAWDLTDYPMIMEELARLCAGVVDRAKLPAHGPVIVSETTSRPWGTRQFQYDWRDCARAAGLPDNIQNRDSRPGAATEADLAGADKDKVRRGLGHAKSQTTEIYLREDLEVNRELARLRTEKRNR